MRISFLLAGGLSFFLRHFSSIGMAAEKRSPDSFIQVQKSEYQQLLAGGLPKLPQEMKAFAEKLRQSAAALGADFDPTEGIINGWHKALAPGQSVANKIEALKIVENLFQAPRDKIILEALRLGRGFLLVEEGKSSEARPLALEGQKSPHASIRYFSGLLRTDTELHIGGYPVPAFWNPPEFLAQKGKVVVLYFWQSWCPPCAKKLPELQALSQKYSGRVAFIGVSNSTLEQNVSDLPDMRKKSGVTFPQITDSGYSTETFRIFNYPRAIVIDRQGRGQLLGPGEDIERAVQNAIAIAR